MPETLEQAQLRMRQELQGGRENETSLLDLLGQKPPADMVVRSAEEDNGLSTEDAAERYLKSGIRQVMLIFDLAEYERVQVLLERLRHFTNKSNNTEAVKVLFNEFARIAGIPAI